MNSFNYYIEGRVFEWVMACSMLSISIESMIWPDVLEANTMPWAASILLFSIGWVRFAALMLNGHVIAGYRVGPFVRAVTGVCCSLVWGQFALSFLRVSIEFGRPSIVLPFMTMVTLGEIYVAFTTVKKRK